MGRMPLGAMRGQGGCGTRLEVERQSQALGWRRAPGGRAVAALRHAGCALWETALARFPAGAILPNIETD